MASVRVFTDSFNHIKSSFQELKCQPIQIVQLFHNLGKKGVEMMGYDYVATYNILFKAIHFKLLTVSAIR